jgi:allantoin racemase
LVKIRVITANASRAIREAKVEHRKRSAGGVAEIDVIGLQRGPVSVETNYEERLASPYLLEEVTRAEREGFDAVVIDCFGDPALRAAREIVDIPVIGAGLVSMLFAMALGDKFSVLTVSNALRKNEEHVRAYCFQARMASMRSVDIPSIELYRYGPEVQKAVYQEAKKAIDEDGADVIVLGCTALSHAATDLSERLGIPVVDPAGAAIKMAIDLVELGLSHSKVAYPKPPDREIMS